MSMNKHAALEALAKKRQRAKWPGYAGIGDYHNGAYECLHVSPYTKSAGNVDASVMILLQDWCSESFLRRAIDQDALELGHAPSLPTNRNLKILLRRHLGLDLNEVFATNLFPFVKPGGMSSSIPVRDLVRAAREYALPQIKIVAPKLVICLGLTTYSAVRRASGLRSITPMASAIESPFVIESTNVWAQAHTGSLGQRNRNVGDKSRVERDWVEMAAAIGGNGSPSS